jgi:hypothetical protein
MLKSPYSTKKSLINAQFSTTSATSRVRLLSFATAFLTGNAVTSRVFSFQMDRKSPYTISLNSLERKSLSALPSTVYLILNTNY